MKREKGEKKGIKEKLFNSWVDSLDVSLALGKAFCELIALKQFVEAISELDKSKDEEDISLKNALSLCCSLFALWCIEKDMGFFLKSGYISSSKAEAITYQVNALCYELTPQVQQILEAVPFSDSQIPGLGKDWVEHYSSSNLVSSKL